VPRSLEVGVLLPHFGQHADRDLLLQTAVAAENYGFDSLWVRDHVVYTPHEHEDPSRVHADPFVVLAAAAAITQRITLGSAVFIPHRHPIHMAVSLGSLDLVAGPGRVIAGWGVGTFDREFEAVGLGHLDRRELVREHVETVRQLLSGKTVSHHGSYSFTDVSIAPTPDPAHPIPMWYGGASKAAVRRAAEYCDGWIASRTPYHPMRELITRLQAVAHKNNRPVPTIAHVPYVVPERTREEVEQLVNLPALLADCQHLFESVPGASFGSLEDVAGAVLWGDHHQIAAGVEQLQSLGVGHLIFDLRPVFADLNRSLKILGEKVLPLLK
jgi:probable F420-dependent oxidoreductase